MTEASTIARDNASHCEARKIALRQSKDGIVVSFVLHPNQVPEALQLAELGTRWMLALVQLDDDEQPKAVAHDRKMTKEPASDDAPMRAPRKPVAAEKRLAQQAGICTGDPVFHKFLNENDLIQSEAVLGDGITWDDLAKATIYDICGVSSRAEIIPGTHAGQAWDSLYSKFVAWKLAA